MGVGDCQENTKWNLIDFFCIFCYNNRMQYIKVRKVFNREQGDWI